MFTKKVLAFSGIRSDYDLLSGLYKRINNDPNFSFGLIVSGAHLSETYGYTVKQIEADNLPILAKIESLLDSNSQASRLKSAAICMQNCLHTVEAFNPDVIIYPGDREDVIVGALVGAYLGITTVHFFGGDHASDGNVDNPIRHAASKLSSLHFVSHPSHKERLLKIGEPANRIFIVGSPALDKFKNTKYISKTELLSIMGKPDWTDYALMIFHPILGYEERAGEYFEEILISMKKCGVKAFVSYPNSDPGNRTIINVIERYKQDEELCFFKNFEREMFINIMRNAKFMIGNSSAGLIESPIIPLGVVNVGSRQMGRLAANNVIFVDQGINNICAGIEMVISSKFQKKLKSVSSPFGLGDSIDKAYHLLKKLDFKMYRYKSEDPLLL